MHKQQNRDLIPLSDIGESVCVFINGINGSANLQVKLFSLGLGIGSAVEILRNRKGDVVLAKGHNRISLGQDVASKLLVTAQ